MNNINEIKAIVTDLDGTALSSKHIFSDYTINVFKQLIKEQKYKLVFATGRHFKDINYLFNSIGTYVDCITNNGATINDSNGKQIYSNYIDSNIVKDILLNTPVNSNLLINIYQDDDWFINQENEQVKEFHKHSDFKYNILDIKNHTYSNVSKIFFLDHCHKNPQQYLSPVLDYINKNYAQEVYITFSNSYCLEVMNKGINKSNAIDNLFKEQGFGIKNCITFGNGLNDFEMLTRAKQGYVVSNADPQLLNVIKPEHNLITIDTNDQDAVAKYIENNFLL